MSIVITGDILWTGALVLFLEALDGGPAADTDGYTFTSSGDMEYSCSITDTILGLYRCVAKTSGGIIAGAGYVTVGASTTAARIRSEEAAELDPASVSAVQAGLATSTSVSTLQTAVDAITAIFTGMTSLPNWLRRAFRKDSGTAGMTTAQTEINNTGGAFTGTTDSLEAIRDNSGGASLEDIISGVQSVSGAIVEAQNSATLSIRIGDTWTQDIGSLGDLTGKTVSFAMKKRASDADTAAIVFITEGTGLTRLNGAATTAGWGSITINDEVAGDITLRLESDATSLLTSGSYVDAVKLLEDGDDRSPRNAGRTVVSAGVIADIT